MTSCDKKKGMWEKLEICMACNVWMAPYHINSELGDATSRYTRRDASAPHTHTVAVHTCVSTIKDYHAYGVSHNLVNEDMLAVTNK